jgi:poly(A) polymerase
MSTSAGDRLDRSRPVGKIPPQPWMSAPETVAVIEALAAAGDAVRFIGGCVRDALLKVDVRDVDIAVALPPQRVMAMLQRAGLKAIPTGIRHGTITAVVDRMHFEITTLRVDVETYGRHAKVAFTDDWVADAARRDFTINALSCTPAGDVYDYFGGLDDLGARRVRFVGDPSERIREDALRLLRFFRFYAHFGRPPPDEDALAACRERADDVERLSGERVRGEVLRILMAADPADALQLMRDNGVLAHVLPEAGTLSRLRMLTWLDSRALGLPTVSADATRRLAALVDEDGGAAERIADRLRFSNRERKRLVAAAARRFAVTPDADAATLARALHRLGAESVRDVALLAWAGELAGTPRPPLQRAEGWIALLARIDAWQPATFPLRGRDAIALGIRRGPPVGRALRAVEDWWEEGGCRAGHAACLEKLAEIAADNHH